MAAKRKSGDLMLIALHAIDSTLEAPFLPAGWEQLVDTSFGTTDINSVAYDGESRLVAVGNSGKIAYSNDNGFTWQQTPNPFASGNIYTVTHGNGVFVAGGSAGKLATSTDGIVWTARDSGFGAGAILGSTYVESSSLWVIVGATGKLATSSDSQSWLLRSSSFGVSFINSVRSLENYVIAVGYDGKLATSIDGVTWTQRGSSFVASTIYEVTYSAKDGSYVAVGDSGKIAFSSNAFSWTQVFPPSTFGSSSIRAITAATDSYVAGGSGGKVGTAVDFTSWSIRDAGFGLDTINEVLVINNSIAIAVGADGRIALSL